MSAWQNLSQELEKWAASSLTPRLWLRDDDAVEPTPALDRLGDICRKFQVPVVLAVIPKPATKALAEWVKERALVSIALHGFNHDNHAPTSEKKCELGLHREPQVVIDELKAGRENHSLLFGEQFIDMLVPPWNRIAPELLNHLPEIGIKTLSTFTWVELQTKTSDLTQLNTHVDIIDWKTTRGGRQTSILIEELTGALKTARERGGLPVGILTHHLVHDEQAWLFLEELFLFTHNNKNVEWCHAGKLAIT